MQPPFNKMKALLGPLLLTGLIATTGGCGRKDLPRAPQTTPPPAVKDLQGAIGHNQVVLSWSLPGGRAAVNQGLYEFQVFRSRWEPADKRCADCPRRFTQTGRILVRNMEIRPDGTLIGHYHEPAVPNGTADYYVLGATPAGNVGERSNTVQLICPPATPKGE